MVLNTEKETSDHTCTTLNHYNFFTLPFMAKNDFFKTPFMSYLFTCSFVSAHTFNERDGKGIKLIGLMSLVHNR